MKLDAYLFRGERTVGGYVSRETLLGRTVWSIGLNLWIGCAFLTVRR